MLDMVDCTEVLPGGQHSENAENNAEFSFEQLMEGLDASNFLCPINLDSLTIGGKEQSDLFEFVQISLKGCNLGADCLSEKEVAKTTFNFVMAKSLPNIMGEDHTSKDIHYTQDTTHIYALDPTHLQTANLYFMESTIRLKSYIWDIFEFLERELFMYEYSYS